VNGHAFGRLQLVHQPVGVDPVPFCVPPECGQGTASPGRGMRGSRRRSLDRFTPSVTGFAKLFPTRLIRPFNGVETSRRCADKTAALGARVGSRTSPSHEQTSKAHQINWFSEPVSRRPYGAPGCFMSSDPGLRPPRRTPPGAIIARPLRGLTL